MVLTIIFTRGAFRGPFDS